MYTKKPYPLKAQALKTTLKFPRPTPTVLFQSTTKATSTFTTYLHHPPSTMGFDDQDDDSSFFHQKNRYDQNSKIMLTAIVSLSIVVVLVTVLHIYARCILRRQARRRAALRQLGIIASVQAHSRESPERRLDPSVIASLPIFIFKKDNGSNNVEIGSIECSVCLSILEEGERARTLPNCKHIFHAECIDKWFSTQSTCPICRTEAEPSVQLTVPQPEPREGTIGAPVAVAIAPTSPPFDGENPASMEGSGMQSSAKINGSSSSSRLSSFRRIISRDRSSQRIQPSGQEDCYEDLERQ